MKQKQLSKKQQKKKQFKQQEQQKQIQGLEKLSPEKEKKQMEQPINIQLDQVQNDDININEIPQLYPSIYREILLQNLNYRRVLICGEKDSGKSTTCLHLCNILQQPQHFIQDRILLLDTDLGQPFVWGLPGFITLYEITDKLPSVPKVLYQGFVGEFSTMNHFDLYFNHIRNIIDMCKESRLIVNTQGFISSFGGVVLQYLLQIIQPEKVFILTIKQHQQAEKLKQKLESQNIAFKLIPDTQLDITQQRKPEIEILSDTSQDNIKQSFICKINSQHRKKYREEKLLRALGINQKKISTNIMKALNELPVQTLKFERLKFFALPYSIELNSKLEVSAIEFLIEVGQQFIMNLVCIADQNQNENIFCDNLQKISINSLGIGMIKDVDLDQETVEIICQDDLSQGDYIIIKSQFYEFGRETMALSLEDLLEFQDHEYLIGGVKINKKFSIPYVFPTIKAIGMSSLKIGINKKIQKKKI